MAHWGHFIYGQAHYDEPDNSTNPNIIKRTHMYDIHKVLTNPFDDPHIGLNGLLAFTTDHQGKMADNNTNGFLTARIAATNIAVVGVNTAFAADLGKLGERKTSKKDKDDYRASMTPAISKIYVTLQGKYGEKSSKLTEFFPNGRTGFNTATDDQVGNNLQTLITAVTAHVADFSQQLVTDATALLTGWNAVYTPSESSSGAKKTAMTAKNNARAALQLELFKNLLTIALQFPRQPEMLDLYMQQSLLEPHTPGTSTPPPAPTP